LQKNPPATIVKVNARSFLEQCAFTITNVRLLCQFTDFIHRYPIKSEKHLFFQVFQQKKIEF